jgi:DNA repair exonuclease SbcCD ATPase subunit
LSSCWEHYEKLEEYEQLKLGYYQEKVLLERDLEDGKQKHKLISQNLEKIFKLEKLIEEKMIIKKMFDKKGISEMILSYMRDKFVSGISILTNLICEYEFMVDDEWNFMIKRGDIKYYIENCSGAEKLILNMAFRLTFSSMDDLTRSNIMIIDESFVSFDKERRDLIRDIIRMILTKYERVLIISHMEELQNIIPSRIEIKSVHGVSSIVK